MVELPISSSIEEAAINNDGGNGSGLTYIYHNDDGPVAMDSLSSKIRFSSIANTDFIDNAQQSKTAK